MGYTLAMSDEIGDWLTDLRSTDLPAARLVAEALTALIRDGASLGPPLVSPVIAPRRPVTMADALDGAYQVCLEKLQIVRRRAADAASDAYRLRQQIAALEAADTPGHEDRLAELRRQLAVADATEARRAAQSRRIQSLIDAFRMRKEVLKARHTALQAEQAAQQILEQFDAEFGPDDGPARDAGSRVAAGAAEPAEATSPGAGAAAQSPAVTGANASAAAAQAASAGPPPTAADPCASAAAPGTPADTAGEAADAESEITQIEREIKREIDRVLSVSGAEGSGGPPAEMLELRPGAPGDDGIRVLFGIEPAGTALLIAVLEGGEALRDHYEEAVELSVGVLREVQAGEAPEAAARTYAAAGEFLGEFFPSEADQLSAGAADLIARNRGRTLAAERSRLGLSQAQVAERMGATRDRVEAVEQAGPGVTDVATLAEYIKALGGRLEIYADYGGERILLRAPTDTAT